MMNYLFKNLIRSANAILSLSMILLLISCASTKLEYLQKYEQDPQKSKIRLKAYFTNPPCCHL